MFWPFLTCHLSISSLGVNGLPYVLNLLWEQTGVCIDSETRHHVIALVLFGLKQDKLN